METLPVEARVQLDDHIEAATLAVGLVDKCFLHSGPHVETVADLRNHLTQAIMHLQAALVSLPPR